MFLRFDDKRFQVRARFQNKYRCFRVGIVMPQAKFDTLPFEGSRISLDLHILIQEPVYRLLRFIELHGHGRLRMELELLLDCFGQVPAEKHKGVTAMTFRMQETPGFIRLSRQK